MHFKNIQQKTPMVSVQKIHSLSTARIKMLIKFFGNNFMVEKILYNIVKGIFSRYLLTHLYNKA